MYIGSRNKDKTALISRYIGKTASLYWNGSSSHATKSTVVVISSFVLDWNTVIILVMGSTEETHPLIGWAHTWASIH